MPIRYGRMRLVSSVLGSKRGALTGSPEPLDSSHSWELTMAQRFCIFCRWAKKKVNVLSQVTLKEGAKVEPDPMSTVTT